MRKTVRFEELNTGDLLAAGFDKIILPIGSCESHGDHLPFGIDAMIAHDLALPWPRASAGPWCCRRSGTA